MKHALLATAFLASLPASASANTMSIAMSNDGALIVCGNLDACNMSSSPANNISFAATKVGDISIALTLGSREFNPDQLSLGQISITNTSKTTAETLKVAIGAQDYAGNPSMFHESATIILNRGSATLDGSFWADGANRLGGHSSGTDLPGVELVSFDSPITSFPHAFSFNDVTSQSETGPFSMAGGLELTLSPGATVGVQGLSLTAVPEPQTWAMFLIGIGLLGGWKWAWTSTAKIIGENYST